MEKNRIRKKPLEADIAEDFIGGVGINNRLAYDIIDSNVSPFSPENPMILGVGPLVGTGTPGCSQAAATAKYPLNGAVADSNGGRRFGTMLKLAGYDHLIITGRSEGKVYLKIDDVNVELCDSSHLWGKDIFETTDALHEEEGHEFSVISIGQGGENLVRYSLAIIDKASTLGANGLGAIMGSKNLKAIIAKGTGKVDIYDPNRFKDLVGGLLKRIKKYPLRKKCVDLGMMQNWKNFVKQLFSRKNWTEIYPEKKANDLYGLEVYERAKKKKMGCPSCPLPDKDVLQVWNGEFKGLKTHTTSYLGSVHVGLRFDLNDEDDHGRSIKVMDELDRRGIDEHTFSSLLDFAIFAFEKNLARKEVRNRLPKNRDFDTVMKWIRRISERESFGNVLADGWIRSLEEMGRETKRCAPAIVKEKDCLWDPRISGLGTMEFEQVVSLRGPRSATGGSPTYIPGQPMEMLEKWKSHADRMGAPEDAIERIFDHELGFNVGRLSKYSEDWYTVLSSLGICNRHMINRFYSIELCADLYSSLTGLEMTTEKMVKCAERSWNVGKIMNLRHGFTKDDDEIPSRWFEPIKDEDGNEKHITDYFGNRRLTKDEIVSFLEDYYDERGWDVNNGMPTEKKLFDLGLEDIVRDLSGV